MLLLFINGSMKEKNNVYFNNLNVTLSLFTNDNYCLHIISFMHVLHNKFNNTSTH